MKRILVTGAGALLGQGILRCLQFAKQDYYVVTADPDVRAQGHALGNKAVTIPMATDARYLPAIEGVIEENKIDAVLIGTDVELPLFAENKNRLEEKLGVKVVVSPKRVIDIANDKWLTAQFLKEKGFPSPASALTTKLDDIQRLKKEKPYPFIAKPVDGARSKGIVIVKNDEDLKGVCSYKNNLVVQEMLSEDEGEFTTGCLVFDGQCKAIVSLRRDLRDGNTYRAYRDGHNPHDEVIKKIAETLGVEGPSNFQYRIREGEPVVFEINARYSGTTPLRNIFGFNEVEATLNHLFGIAEVKQPALKDGSVFRTTADIFVPNEQLEELSRKGSLENYSSQYYPFKVK